jgi:hypothetical protein
MRALFIRAIPAVFVLPLFTTPGAAQERCKFSSDSDPATVTSYPQQLNIDVGDSQVISSACFRFIACPARTRSRIARV